MNKLYFKLIVALIFMFPSACALTQVIPNGTIDNLEELRTLDTVYTTTADGIKLATDIYTPVFRDSIVTTINIGGSNYTVQVVPKNTQYIIYDTSNINADSYSLPIIFSRTPYNKSSDDVGGNLFPFLGYGFAMQDMRGRYGSQGVYFPMYSDAWPKASYHPNISIPMDVTAASSPVNSIHHQDGSGAIYDLADSVQRFADVTGDGVEDTILYSNGDIGMFGASALGNSQYQALSDIPFTTTDNPIKCLLPIVGTNEHYNTTLFNNGVYRNSLTNGWVIGQMTNGIDNNLVGTDNSIYNSLHSPADYNYTDNQVLAIDLLDWFVSNDHGTSPSGAHPTSSLRSDLDASMAPINTSGQSDPNGNVSRYKNLNQPIYHLTGWWDIFVNGQIETFNKVRNNNPGLNQKLVIGPWAHQTVGQKQTGDVTYPDNVLDVLKIDLSIDPNDVMNSNDFLNNLYESEILAWYRSHLGGKPYFIIPESQTWQSVGGDQIRVPSENYVVPYYKYLNYIGGEASLDDIPIEVNSGGNISTINYSLPPSSPSLVNLNQPLTPVDTNYFANKKDIRMYITGPTNDPDNTNVGNYWWATDSLPFKGGVNEEKYYLHKNKVANLSAPTQNEGQLSYTADPNNPVITIGGNNMIPDVPGGGQNSQGAINVANPNYINQTMNRSDVLSFETDSLSDTMTVVGFPQAAFYAKGHTTTQNTAKTDFDVMVRVIDVYPDGREMFVTEGVVNAKSREYAQKIAERDTNENIQLTNIENDTYYYFKFDLLPLGHTFGKNHKIKFLVSSSNYPRYQSNPHIPNELGEFFRWMPGSSNTYNYQGNNLSAQSADITFGFNDNFPNYIQLPKIESLTAEMTEKKKEKVSFEIYPNPNNGQFKVAFEEQKRGVIEIINPSGRLIRTQKYSGQKQVQINLQDAAAGVYFVRCSESQQVKKFVVK